MATEQEELQLVVTLDDTEALARIANLKNQLAGVSSGAGFGKIGESAERATKGVKDLSFEIAKGTFWGNIFSKATEEAVKFGKEVADRATDIQGLSKSIVDLSTQAARMGTSMGQLRSNLRVFDEMGVDAGAAKSTLMGLADSMANLATINGDLRGKLRSGGFLTLTEMLKVLQDADEAGTVEEFAEVMRKAGERIKEFAGPLRGAEEMRRFFATLKASELDQLEGKLARINKAQDEYARRQETILKQFYAASRQAGDGIERIAEAVGTVVGAFSLPWMQTLAFTFKTASEYAEKIALALSKVHLPPVVPALPGPIGPALDFWAILRGLTPKPNAAPTEPNAAPGSLHPPSLNHPPMKFMGGSVQGGDWDSSNFTGSGNEFWRNLQGRGDVDVEDRRNLEDNTDQTKALTEQMRQLNDALTNPMATGRGGGLAAMGAALGLGDLGGGGRGGGRGWTGGGRYAMRSPSNENIAPSTSSTPPASVTTKTEELGPGGLSVQPGTVAPVLPPELGGPATAAASSGGKSYAGGTAKQQVAQNLANELRAQGVSENAIAGMMANVKEESAFNPETRHADQPKFGGEAHFAHGLFQEGGAEWNIWAADMQARGLDPNTAWKDPKEQARFVAGRLKGTIGNQQYAKLYEQMQNAKSPGEAAALFAKGYLKPAAPYLAKRLKDFERQGVPGTEAYTGKPTGDQATSAAAAEKQSPGSGAAAPSGDARLKTVGNYKLGGDTRRQALLDAAREASKNLPPGYRVEAYSGQREGANQGPHRTSGAIDFRIIDPQGKMLGNYQDPANFAAYEQFAQDTHAALLKTNPALAAQHRFGGYFSGPIGPGGQYGAMDLMHQDVAGQAMAAGGWQHGLSAAWARRWRVGEHSAGFSARQAELAARGGRPPGMSDAEWTARKAKALNLAAGEGALPEGSTLDQFTQFGSGLSRGGVHSDLDEGYADWAAQQRRKLDLPINLNGRAMDSSQGLTVTGKGSLKVDVNGPPGTRVSGSGQGLLKDTSISRATQMVPASAGPKQPAGEMMDI